MGQHVGDDQTLTAALLDRLLHHAHIVQNTDQDRQFTSLEFTDVLKQHGIRIRMDAKADGGQRVRGDAMEIREV